MKSKKYHISIYLNDTLFYEVKKLSEIEKKSYNEIINEIIELHLSGKNKVLETDYQKQIDVIITDINSIKLRLDKFDNLFLSYDKSNDVSDNDIHSGKNLETIFSKKGFKNFLLDEISKGKTEKQKQFIENKSSKVLVFKAISSIEELSNGLKQYFNIDMSIKEIEDLYNAYLEK